MALYTIRNRDGDIVATQEGSNESRVVENILSIRGHLNDLGLSGMNLPEVDLRGASIKRTNLENSMLAGANLSGADLSQSIFRGADLTRANLAGVDLRYADLRKAIICDANLDGAKISYRDGTVIVRFEQQDGRAPSIDARLVSILEEFRESLKNPSEDDWQGEREELLDTIRRLRNKVIEFRNHATELRRSVFDSNKLLNNVDVTSSDVYDELLTSRGVLEKYDALEDKNG